MGRLSRVQPVGLAKPQMVDRTLCQGGDGMSISPPSPSDMPDVAFRLQWWSRADAVLTMATPPSPAEEPNWECRLQWWIRANAVTTMTSPPTPETEPDDECRRWWWQRKAHRCGPKGHPTFALHAFGGWMIYGCEFLSLADWDANLEKICVRHVGDDAEAYTDFLRPIITDAMEATE